MRISQIILVRGMAGAQRHVAELSNELAKRHDVSLILRCGHADDRRGGSIESLVDRAVRVVRVPFLLRHLAVPLVLRRLRPDVIHTHAGHGSRLVGGLRSRVPAVGTLHLSYRPKDFHRHDALICVAEWQRRTIPADYRGEVHVIGNWVRPHHRLDAAAVAALRRDMGAGPDDFVIGAVGRLHRVKGFDLLIQAFAQAKPERARLVIVGDGEERARLEALAGERVVFLGYQRRAKDYYQAFDLLAVSSRDEPFSLTILEAMDADLPIVATAAEGPKQILTGQPAELVPLDDVEALAAALRRAAEARPGRVRYDLSRFSLAARAREIEAIYQRLAAGATREGGATRQSAV